MTLAAAVGAQADAVDIEPMAMADDAYVVTLERASISSGPRATREIGFPPALESP